MSKNRRIIRLRGYDYSQAGIYFVTICAQNRRCIFGDILNGEMRLNDTGKIVAGEWVKSAEIRDEIELDEWVVMPNHFHGIVWIRNGDIDPMYDRCRGDRCCEGDRPVAPTTGPRPRSLGALIAGFKSAVTKQINQIHQTPGGGLWQRNYWEHIIRNEDEFNRIRKYIVNNPARWDLDQENPHAIAPHRDRPRRGNQHRGDRHRDDQHRDDRHRDDQHRDDRHRGDRHRGDRHRGDRHCRGDRPVALEPEPGKIPGEKQ